MKPTSDVVGEDEERGRSEVGGNVVDCQGQNSHTLRRIEIVPQAKWFQFGAKIKQMAYLSLWQTQGNAWKGCIEHRLSSLPDEGNTQKAA